MVIAARIRGARPKLGRMGIASARVLQAGGGMLTVVLALDGDPAGAQSGQSLQEAAQNPIADLISVPFQNNFNFGMGERGVTQYVLNVQPVYPATLTLDWNLIVRPIVPVINQPKAFDGPASEGVFGLGDISLQTYFSPSKTVETALGSVSWGVGPTLVFPSATDDLIGSSKWSAGPGAVVFIAKPPFTYGALVNNVWSYAGDEEAEDVNQLLVQPFVNYNLPDGWSVGMAPIITANWEAEDGERWTLPLGGGVGKLMEIAGQAVQTNLRAYYNVVTPDFGPDWQLQFQLTLLFPK
jgi:hypothetical protein